MYIMVAEESIPKSIRFWSLWFLCVSCQHSSSSLYNSRHYLMTWYFHPVLSWQLLHVHVALRNFLVPPEISNVWTLQIILESLHFLRIICKKKKCTTQLIQLIFIKLQIVNNCIVLAKRAHIDFLKLMLFV